MIPLQTFDLVAIEFGSAIFVVGLVAVLLVSIISTQNVPALITWAFSVLVLLFVGIVGIPVELFWICMIITVILLMIGVAVRWET